jgi:DNA transformation protein and related proteins
MSVSADFLNYVLGQLSALEGLATRRMFGAVGLYGDGAFFALISGDVLYFKVGDGNRHDYESRNMSRFRPYRDRPQLSMRYYEVPAEVLEDAEECVLWARRSVIVAASDSKEPPRKSRQSQRKRAHAKSSSR